MSVQSKAERRLPVRPRVVLRKHSQKSLRVLARRYGINPKTVAKWKKRKSVKDRPTGPKVPHSTVLSLEEEAVIVISMFSLSGRSSLARCGARAALLCSVTMARSTMGRQARKDTSSAIV